MNSNLLAGKYLVKEMIGKGGIGEIYKGFDTKKKRVVAIKKLMSVDKVRKRRFKREYRLLQKIDHPFFVRASDFFEHEEHAYLVMEFIEGRTLKEIIIDYKNCFSFPEQLAIANKIARSVEILNLAGIIHRDIKPENIIIDEETGDIKLLDLGLAKDTTYNSVQITKGDDFMGTPLYASPEQVMGQNSYQSDIFSLSTVLYQFFLWENKSPFYDENEFAILYKITDYNPPTLMEKILLQGKNLSPQEREAYQSLSEVIKRGMDKDPAKRQETAAKIADFFAQIQQSLLHAQKYSQAGIKRLELSNPVDTLLSKKLATIRISYQDIHGSSVPQKAEVSKQPLTKILEYVQKQKMALFVIANIVVLILLTIFAVWIFSDNNNQQQTIDTNNSQWIIAKEFANEAGLLMNKALTAEKQQYHAFLNESKNLYVVATQKAKDFFISKINEAQKEQKTSYDNAKIYVRNKFTDYYIIMADWEKNISKIDLMLLTENHIPMDESTWLACWDKEQKLIDFTAPQWQKLSHTLQIEYARKYQAWHAKQNQKNTEKEFNIKNIKISMIYIPPAKFWQGSPATEIDRDPHEQRRIVTISQSFWLGKYEVTQGQWFAITGKKPWLQQELMQDNPSHPVNFVSWDDIQSQFISVLGKEYDLPSESQWEYACRAGTYTKFYWGNEITYIGKNANVMDKSTTNKYPHFPGIDVLDGFPEIAEVGSLQKNPFGLYDMIGNATEWCNDNYTNFANPSDTAFSTYKVQRGGAWNSFWIGSLRSAYRTKQPSDYKSNSCGFRICKLTE